MVIKIGQFEQSDVTFWGMATVVAAGIAVLSTSISAFVPAGVFGSLHASRIDGSTLNQLRAQVEQLNKSQRELLSSTNQLRSQFTLSERKRTQVNQRVGALEVSIPMLLEVVPPGAEIDPLSITASIGDEKTESFDTEGGSVVISRSPLFEGALPNEIGQMVEDQKLPPDLGLAPEVPVILEQGDNMAPTEPAASIQPPQFENIESQNGDISSLSQTQYGIAVGKPVTQEEADAMWQDISNKVGTLLIGLEPAVSDPLQNNSLRVVFGPITNYSEAETLCHRISLVGIECLPIQYMDQELNAL